LVTIDQNVAIDLHLDKMVAGEPDADALRKLFSELEFTTLLKELAPAVEVKETDYRELKSAAQLKELSEAGLHSKAPLAVAFAFAATATEAETEEAEAEGSQPETDGLLFSPPPQQVNGAEAPLKLALSAGPGKALTASLGTGEISAELTRV